MRSASWCEVGVCVCLLLFFLFPLWHRLWTWCVSWTFFVSDFEVDDSQTFAVSQKAWRRCRIGTRTGPENESNIGNDASPVGAHIAPLKAFLACVKTGAPPPPEGTPFLQQRPTWPGPPSAPPLDLAEEGTPALENRSRLSEEMRTFSRWGHRIGAFLGQPRG